MGKRRIAISLAMMPVLVASVTLKSTGSRAGVGSGSGATGSPAAQPVVVTPNPVLEIESPNDMGHNGLSSTALFDNALTVNPTALDILINNPLNDDILKLNNSYIEQQLQHDRPAQAVMTDLVACALGNGDHVGQWGQGEMGLCTKNTQDSWLHHRPSESCKQLVSACLFAKVNALHRRVPISFHAPGNILPMKASVRLETKYREGINTEDLSTGTSIPGFRDEHNHCSSAQGCWMPARIGTCVPNKPLQLVVSNSGSLQCSSASIQICKGIYGCELGDVGKIPSSVLEYSGVVLSHQPNSTKCIFDFACPSQGSYGVMIKPSVFPMTANTPKYPAPETDVFSFREAAFFGNLFEPTQLTHTREIIVKDGNFMLLLSTPTTPIGATVHSQLDTASTVTTNSSCRQSLAIGSPYKHVYACYSIRDKHRESKDIQLSEQDGVANFNDRVCADPDSSCFPNKVKSCSDPSYNCGWDGQAYTNCTGDGVSYTPITTFLDDPCTLVDSAQCATLRAHRAVAPHREISRHGIPMANYQATFDLIVATPPGYRPIWVDGYEVAGATFFNALFAPSNSTWVARHNMTAADFQTEFNLRVSQRMRLSQVDSYLVSGQVRYAAIFDSSPGAPWTAYFNVNQATHDANVKSLVAQGYHPVNISAVTSGGVRTFTALFDKTDVGSFVTLIVPEADYQARFDANVRAGRSLSYINAFMESGAAKFSAIWDQARVGPWVAHHGMTSAQYQDEFDTNVSRELLARRVTGYESGGGARFASLFTTY